MNIDLEKANNQFIKYTERYDLENERIKGIFFFIKKER